MNTTGTMHELIFPNIYILLNITYYVLPLTIIIGLVIIRLGFKGQSNNLQFLPAH